VVVITRMGEMRIVNEEGIVLVTSEIPYGSTLESEKWSENEKG
jgi:hypothetical protein